MDHLLIILIKLMLLLNLGYITNEDQPMEEVQHVVEQNEDQPMEEELVVKKNEDLPKEEVEQVIEKNELEVFLENQNYLEDYEILLEEKNDFDSDGKEEIIVAIGEPGEAKYIPYILLLNETDVSYEVIEEYKSRGYIVDDVTLVKIKDFEEPLLMCALTNLAYLSGFQLLEITSDGFKEYVYSASGTGVGTDTLVDSDDDGVYDAFLQERRSYDYLYQWIRISYELKDQEFYRSFAYLHMEPKKTNPEFTVFDLLGLTYIENALGKLVFSQQESFEGLSKVAYKRPYIFGHYDLYYQMLGIDSALKLRVVDDNSVVLTYKAHDFMLFDLENKDGTYTISDYHMLMDWESFLTQIADGNDLNRNRYHVYDNKLFLKRKDILLSEDYNKVSIVQMNGDTVYFAYKDGIVTDVIKAEDGNIITSFEGEIYPLKYDNEVYYITYVNEIMKTYDFVDQHFVELKEYNIPEGE